MPYYHVSPRELAIGEVLAGGPPASLGPTHAGPTWVDACFNREAPANGPCRGLACYAFDSLENCNYYLSQYFKSKQFWVYEVTLSDDRVRCPWALVQRMTAVGQCNAKAATIAKEYWNATYAWQHWEFIASSATVVADVTSSIVPQAYPYSASHLTDAGAAQRRWP